MMTMTQDQVCALYDAHRDAGDDPINAVCRTVQPPVGEATGATEAQALEAARLAGDDVD